MFPNDFANWEPNVLQGVASRTTRALRTVGHAIDPAREDAGASNRPRKVRFYNRVILPWEIKTSWFPSREVSEVQDW